MYFATRISNYPLRRFLELRAKTVEKYHLPECKELLIAEWPVTSHRKGASLLSYKKMAAMKQKICDMAGIQFKTHDRRRSYGKRLRKAGLPIETVAKCLRHEQINQVFRAYIGIEGDELTEAQDRLNRGI